MTPKGFTKAMEEITRGRRENKSADELLKRYHRLRGSLSLSKENGTELAEIFISFVEGRMGEKSFKNKVIRVCVCGRRKKKIGRIPSFPATRLFFIPYPAK